MRTRLALLMAAGLLVGLGGAAQAGNSTPSPQDAKAAVASKVEAKRADLCAKVSKVKTVRSSGSLGCSTSSICLPFHDGEYSLKVTGTVGNNAQWFYGGDCTGFQYFTSRVVYAGSSAQAAAACVGYTDLDDLDHIVPRNSSGQSLYECYNSDFLD